MNTILLVVLLVQIGAATVAGLLAERLFGPIGITISSIALTLALFVYSEAIPKTYAVRHPFPVARRLSIPIAVLVRLLRPVVSLLVAFADLQSPGKGVVGPLDITEAELRRLAAEAAEAGTIEETDAALVERIFEIGDLVVREIMVPRTDVVGIRSGASVSDAVQLAVQTGHRRLPVYRDSLDDVIGVVRLADLASVLASDRSALVDGAMAPVIAVPETKPVTSLLREMQEASVHFAIVIDEHGGSEGIVTIEDVVGRLVGAVADEGRAHTPLIRRLDEDRWEVDGRALVDDVEDELGVRLPEGEWTTIAGLVTGVAGRILDGGDAVVVADHRFVVARAERQRVEMLHVERVGG